MPLSEGIMIHDKKTTSQFVEDSLRLAGGTREPLAREIVANRYDKALSLLPDEVLSLFLSGKRQMKVIVMPDPKLPTGMFTKTDGSPGQRKYTVFLYEEHTSWPEDHFLGAFLRELGHVVTERPPEEEWPRNRGERARFKEMLECRADATVWQWGLRHYSIRYIAATYPEHWVERIVKQIGDYCLAEDRKSSS